MAAIFIAVCVGVRVWVPKAVLDYLNRPDTKIRQKGAAALSEKLGEPVSLDFKISGVTLTPLLHLAVSLSDIQIESPTFRRIGTMVREADVEVAVLKSLVLKKIEIERVALRIPTLSLEPGPDGSWPHEKLTRPRVPPGPPPVSETQPSNRPIELAHAEIEVDTLRLKAGSAWAEIRGLAVRMDLRQFGTGPSAVTVSSRDIFSGRLEGMVSIPPAGSPVDISGKWTHVDLSKFNPLLKEKNIRLAGDAAVTADIKQFSVARPSGMRGELTVNGNAVEVSGLPTFSGLASTLNALADAVAALLEGPASTAGSLAKGLNRLLGKISGAAEGGINEKGTTRFDHVKGVVQLSNGQANIQSAEFSNADVSRHATGTVGLSDGKLDLNARIAFQEGGLKQFSSAIVRKIFSEGVDLPVPGTVMDPQFDKGSFIKPIARRAGNIVKDNPILKKLGFGRH